MNRRPFATRRRKREQRREKWGWFARVFPGNTSKDITVAVAGLHLLSTVLRAGQASVLPNVTVLRPGASWGWLGQRTEGRDCALTRSDEYM
jgi:hypothetical protein